MTFADKLARALAAGVLSAVLMAVFGGLIKLGLYALQTEAAPIAILAILTGIVVTINQFFRKGE